MLHNSMTNFNNLCIFECLCFAYTLENNRNKLDPRSRKCLFLGFKSGIKGYIVIDINTIVFFSLKKCYLS